MGYDGQASRDDRTGGPVVVPTIEAVIERLHEGRRARLLTALCVLTATLHVGLIAWMMVAGQLEARNLPPRLVMDLALLFAPLAHRWTGSMRATALGVGTVVAIALPVIALGSGGLAAPMMVVVPLVPLLMSSFVGGRGVIFMGAAVAAGLAVVALAPGPPHAPDQGVRVGITGACLAVAVIAAFLHERERTAIERSLRRLALRLREESIRDGLTGLYNRRYLDDRLAAELAFARRHGTDVSVVVFDIDWFKRVNDEHGHPAGDRALTEIAAVLRQEVRSEDVVARLGGEEFAVLLRATSVADAHRMADRIRERVARETVRHGTASIRLTVSAGCASRQLTAACEPASLLAAADAMLYEAKRLGRNRVVSLAAVSTSDEKLTRRAPEEIPTPRRAPAARTS